ncbi:heavy metal translocating P-type ATPase [Blattabacterium cuenoti]|uniref:heavy metal translocating P-type ATPase n=1 Tax=Blattabacterium cuenoti TaxID=1653831 RepID=UPI00163CE15C|nr:HAD-IC family P-type ATPase [Blattabacterium cuenoti]
MYYNHNNNQDFNYLDDEKIKKQIIDFKEGNITAIRFFIPSIKCISCILYLENLSNIHKYILKSTVTFTSKQLSVIFYNDKFQLSELARFLKNIGYPPYIQINNKIQYNQHKIDRQLIAKLAISFFCFGNIMLLSIPEYLGASIEDAWFVCNRNVFRYVIFCLSIPIIILSIFDHIKYAFLGLKNHLINIDLPISIGILTLFLWSFYEILFDIGYGYFDSLAGFYFFLLISKIIQINTHKKIFLFKDYKQYYPIYVSKINQHGEEEKIILYELKIKDIIIIRNEEIIPADSILVKGIALLDNSFITGESYIIKKKIGDRIYAGSKQKGSSIFVKVIKHIDQSYISLLWNKQVKSNNLLYINSISNKLIQYFTPFILLISIMTGIYWFCIDSSKILQTTISVLIVACPCGISLSAPFIFGNMINFLSKKGFYIKDICIMEKLSTINTLIFDKTGTITDLNKKNIFFIGNKLSFQDKLIISSLLIHSHHPLSQMILTELSIKNIKKYYSVSYFKEIIGMGIRGLINNKIFVKIGSPKFLNLSMNNHQGSTVCISIDSNIIGYFVIKNNYRQGIKQLFKKLTNYDIIILSGDNNQLEKKYLQSILPKKIKIYFNQTPEDKLKYITNTQKIGKIVMMIGDGINDSAALKKSDIGLALSEKITNFFPNCDAFIKSNYLRYLPLFLQLSKISVKLVGCNLLISLFYNLLGFIFAITGKLTPFISAILMPCSSFSVILFSLISTWIISKKFI